jgi:anaerobic magnesium-protoporphyrin IX monomethyl ester cyclase
MKVLLVQSYTMLDQPPIFPLGVCFLAAALPMHDVAICDLNTLENPFEDIERKIRDWNPDVVGISLRNIKIFTPEKHIAYLDPHIELVRRIKKVRPDIRVIAGGSGFSLYAEVIMRKIPEIDFGVFGEGEITFPKLLADIDKPYNVEGIYYREKEEVIFTGPRPFLDFHKSLMPRWDLVDMTKYYNEDSVTSVGVQTKRGCSQRCIHCSDTYLVGNNIRLRSAKSVVDELEILRDKYKVTMFSFVDQIFNIPIGHAEEICREMIGRKLDLQWTAWFNERHLTDNLLALIKQAGCIRMEFSSDSVSDTTLKKLHKNITAQDLKNSYQLAKKYDIDVTYNFMLNGPGETLLSLLQLAVFVLKAKLALGGRLKLHGLFMVITRIYPHTELRQLAIQKRLISEGNDLLAPVFYNPVPLKYVANSMIFFLKTLWKIKHTAEKLLLPAR